MEQLRGEHKLEWIIIDASYVKAHAHACEAGGIIADRAYDTIFDFSKYCYIDTQKKISPAAARCPRKNRIKSEG